MFLPHLLRAIGCSVCIALTSCAVGPSGKDVHNADAGPGDLVQCGPDSGDACECLSEDGGRPSIYYPDCDGDGKSATAGVRSCEDPSKLTSTCKDGKAPQGAFTRTKGTDCDDNDATAIVVASWYPDCDNDGKASAIAVEVCGVPDAMDKSPCKDGKMPDGKYSVAPGQDCDDEDATVMDGSCSAAAPSSK